MHSTATTVETDDHSYQDTLDYLYGRINYERLVAGQTRYSFRLQRITELLRRLGLEHFLYDPDGLKTDVVNPKPRVPLVHIAGTKGKGSVAAMVSSVLSLAGIRTGLYTSPHLHELEERFQVDSTPCSRQELVSLVDRIKPVAQEVEKDVGPPSFFELTTAIALLHFDSVGCGAVVLEVGLGGRLDSTNACASTVTAVTSIGLDHQHVLGDTIVAIAGEKAGILKPGVPVVSGVLNPEAAEVIAQRATAVGSELFQLGRDFDVQSVPADPWGSNVTVRLQPQSATEQVEVCLAMEGAHQARNAAVAISIIDLLKRDGLSIPDQAVTEGLAQLRCTGRIERFELPGGVLGIVDAAHNHDSIVALCDCVRGRTGERPVSVVFGTSVDKDAGAMLRSLAGIADHITLTRFWGNPRFRLPEELLPLVPESLSDATELIEDPITACETALANVARGGVLISCGSFFLAAETRKWFIEQSQPS